MKAAIVTISTSRATDPGAGEDRSGPALESLIGELGLELSDRELLADDEQAIADCLRRLCDDEGCSLVLTSGGTGFSPSDRTPEATRAVIDREAPGIAEAMRLASREHTPHWPLSRAVAGIRGSSLIINFPGSPRSIEQAGAAIAGALPHALALLGGQPSQH